MSPESIKKLLVELHIAEADETPAVTALSGGVSSSIFRVTVRSGTYCVKQALSRLKVEKEWRVPTNRVFAEIAWLQEAARIVPGHAPRVLGVSEKDGAFVMEYLDQQTYRNWKTTILEGKVEAGDGRQIASVLGRLHRATAGDQRIADRFANRGNFYLLRLEPYFIEAAARNPDLADELIALVHSTQRHAFALMHGDVSPKNLFLGESGAVFLDAECACFGDPAFDLAFLLNHLLLKSIYRPSLQSRLSSIFAEVCAEYLTYVTWEARDALDARAARLIPGLLLARVDGKSPVEYLSAKQRAAVRQIARGLLIHPEGCLTSLASAWSTSLPTGESRAADRRQNQIDVSH